MHGVLLVEREEMGIERVATVFGAGTPSSPERDDPQWSPRAASDPGGRRATPQGAEPYPGRRPNNRTGAFPRHGDYTQEATVLRANEQDQRNRVRNEPEAGPSFGGHCRRVDDLSRCASYHSASPHRERYSFYKVHDAVSDEANAARNGSGSGSGSDTGVTTVTTATYDDEPVVGRWAAAGPTQPGSTPRPQLRRETYRRNSEAPQPRTYPEWTRSRRHTHIGVDLRSPGAPPVASQDLRENAERSSDNWRQPWRQYPASGDVVVQLW